MTDSVELSHILGLNREPLARVLSVLDGGGEEARVVGGAVRNALLGLPPGDIDIATTALPEEVMRRATAIGLKAVPTGIDHGTVTVIADGHPFEVTTLREDVETFGRKARVRFGRDWARDAQRRDFTINAMGVTRDGALHDHVGGIADVRARKVRFIGDPATRIAEDYLRILRFFRFHGAYGVGAPDPQGLAACIAARNGVAGLSRERVRAELMKLLLAAHAVPVLTVMAEAGILGTVLGGVPLLAGLSNMVRAEAAIDVPPSAVRRLAALNVMIVEDADRLWQRLRLTNSEHRRLVSMGDSWWRIVPEMEERDARVLLYRLSPEQYLDRVLLAWSRGRNDAADVTWRKLATLPARWTAPKYPLRARDFAARGIAAGPRMGEVLTAGEHAWISAGFPTDRAALAVLADAVARAAAPAQTKTPGG